MKDKGMQAKQFIREVLWHLAGRPSWRGLPILPPSRSELERLNCNQAEMIARQSRTIQWQANKIKELCEDHLV